MPPITRWFIKSGMIYFILGITLAFVAELPFVNTGGFLLPVYWHMLVLGWITQLIMGVSIWMFPRKKHQRKNIQTVPAILAFWFLNAGLLMRLLTEPFIPIFKSDGWVKAVVILSSFLLFLSVIFYIVEIWPRIFSKKKRKRKK
ncbi:MAG: hypothetical protein R3220_12395 [Balneolaceae bacterium]|nr:hypothetical protein [Balneolaceae bacterium]